MTPEGCKLRIKFGLILALIAVLCVSLLPEPAGPVLFFCFVVPAFFVGGVFGWFPLALTDLINSHPVEHRGKFGILNSLPFYMGETE